MPSSLVKKCSCDARADCIHTVTLSSSSFSKVYQYTQCSFTQDIYTVDKDGNGIDVSVSIIKKNKQSACLPRCGSGVIFNDFGDGFYNPLNEGMNNVTLKYRGKESVPSAIEFINAIVLADKFAIKPSDYRLQVFECAGRFENEKLFYSQSGVVYNNTSGGLNVVDTVIHVYPEASFSVNLTLSYTGSTSTYTDEERKQARAEQNTNRKASKQKDLRNAHKGWTKYTPEFKQENELKVEGESQYTFGNKTEKYKEELFSKKTKKDKYTLSVIDKSFDTIGKFSSMLTSGKESFKLIETKIKPPCIKLNGSGTFNPKHEQYNIDKKLTVELSPLIGMSVTLDLIQALAAYCKVDSIMELVRDDLSCKERESNCADLKCNLVAESNINTTFDIKTENNIKDIEFAGVAKGEVIFKLDSNLSVKYNVWVVSGVFEVGANVIAKGYTEFQKIGDDIELVFYHDGVVAMVNMKYKYELNNENDLDSNFSFEHPETNKSEKWVLFDKLPKNSSTYKVKF
ncbi:hypothetical protein IHC87_05255 [Photobacterium damselae subsp. damselae]|uniref:hypothetical protein n=1 Tax=Photobacterium damselae TaxID=38293 RepID=UPI001F460CB9|nr:hypothetical protein [Photobacterium damselae]UJZ94780.1 hypothetical protein IHC87_05255 [Photobacterium damselae subsp. damselae]UJZ98764.1 hypothetical protein IHC88_05260 [Photobacterium damselae subsp. damselae]